MARLDEIFHLQMGKTPSRNNLEYWADGKNCWVSIADLGTYQKYTSDTKEKITDIAVCESGIKCVPENTVIMSFKLSLGKTAITKEPVYTNEAIMAFIPTGKFEVLPDYFYYVFSGRDWSKDTNRAVMGSTLNKATLSEISVDVPSLEEQQKIAAVLDKVSDLIAKRRQQLEKLDLLVKARFVEMFGKEDWKIDSLSSVAIITGGLTKNSNRNSFKLKLPYLRVANVFFNKLDLNEVQYIGVKENEIEKTLLKKDDLLFVEGNGSKEQIGRVALWNGSIEPCLHQNHLIKARFKLNEINPLYALFYFMSDEGRKQIIGKSVSTSGLNTLSIKKIESLRIPIPEITLQNEFATFAKQTEKTKTSVKESLKKLETLKKALMQKYFG